MRRIATAGIFAVTSALLAACGSSTNVPSSAANPHSRAYFGWVLGEPSVTAVAFDVDPVGTAGRKLRAYVCDGLGPPAGKAIWFSGAVGANRIRATGGNAQLTISKFSNRLVLGGFRDGRGRSFQFAAYPAIDGAGIYQVTVGKDLHVTGTSLTGDRVDARIVNKRSTTGAITTTDGTKLTFTVRNLSLATPVELRRRGLPNVYKRYARSNQVPGEYTAVIAPDASHWLGRSGFVRTGSPSGEIIGLDKKVG